MARVKSATLESVPEHQREAFDAFVAQRGSIPTTGPLSVMLNAPEMLARGEHLRAYLRGDESSLPENIRELAMLVTAREMDCQHIWNAHAGSAREAGLPSKLVDDLREKRELTGLAPDEEAVVNLGREFFRTHKVSRGAFQAALEQFGQTGVVELTLTMGNYTLLSFAINTFDTDLPPNRSEPLLPI